MFVFSPVYGSLCFLVRFLFLNAGIGDGLQADWIFSCKPASMEEKYLDMAIPTPTPFGCPEVGLLDSCEY